MKRVTGIGGLFFKAKDPEKIKEWYKQHLGLPCNQYGANFTWKKDNGENGYTVWSPFKEDTTYFDPAEKPFMFNYRVENLDALLEVLKAEGVTVVGTTEVYDYGKFGWIMDPEGNKIELWEPVDKVFDEMNPDAGKTDG
jgi:predicted enzyme related to lactoylglutathione lyase